MIRLSDLLKFPIRINHYDKEHGNEHFVFGIETVLEYAENLPTVDAVEVVRCEKCRYHFTVDDDDICRRPGLNGEMLVTPDGFCAWGESKNGSI